MIPRITRSALDHPGTAHTSAAGRVRSPVEPGGCLLWKRGHPIHTRRTLVGPHLPIGLSSPTPKYQRACLTASACPHNSSRNTCSRLIERTHHRGPGPLASTPPRPAGASQLLQAGPPTRPATVLTALRFSRSAGSPSPSTRSWTAVSGRAFRGRDRRCRRPPGQIPACATNAPSISSVVPAAGMSAPASAARGLVVGQSQHDFARDGRLG